MNSAGIYSKVIANIKDVLIWLMIWDHECKHDSGAFKMKFSSIPMSKGFSFSNRFTVHLKLIPSNYSDPKLEQIYMHISFHVYLSST